MATFLALNLPLSNYYSNIHYWNGIMALDGYILGILPIFFKQIKHSKLFSNTRLLVFIIIVSIFYVLVALNKDSNLFWVIKDTRPIIYLFTIVLISKISDIEQFYLSLRDLNFLAITAATSNLIWLVFGSLNLILVAKGDLYVQNNIYRYFDLSTYFSAYHLIYIQYLKSNNKLKIKNTNLSIILSLVSILISNSRMLFIAVIIGIGIVRKKEISKLFSYVFLTVFILGAFLLLSELIGQARVFQSINSQGLLLQLENRYSPAIIALKKMTEINYIFGLGLGYYFEIPWFEYRGMDTNNASLDSSYLTHFIKQGLLGLMLLFVTIKSISVFSFSKRLSTSYLVFWVLVLLIAAPLYQNVIYGVILYMTCLKGNLKFILTSQKPNI